MTVRWSPRATQDAREIWLYIAADEVAHADVWLERVPDKLDDLAATPAIGTPRDELLPRLRSRTLGNYRIFYRELAAGGIEVLRIIHAARDLRQMPLD